MERDSPGVAPAPLRRLEAALFAYGTLQFEAVLVRVCGRSFHACPAVLHGYACYYLLGRDYPGLASAPDALTRGVLYRGLPRVALARLDRYEGAEYRRLQLAVATAGGTAQAWVYLPRPPVRLSARPWRAEEFARRGYRRWLNNPRNGL